jgi:hypothetical protein
MTSLGEFSRRPSNASASTVIVPSCSVRVTRRMKCSQLISRPWRSTELPLELKLGERNTDTDPSVSSKRIIRLFGMSDQIR